jgi:hypothetical protein
MNIEDDSKIIISPRTGAVLGRVRDVPFSVAGLWDTFLEAASPTTQESLSEFRSLDIMEAVERLRGVQSQLWNYPAGYRWARADWDLVSQAITEAEKWLDESKRSDTIRNGTTMTRLT